MTEMETNTLQRFGQVAQIHRANIQKSLEHRLKVAIAKKDENLIRLLEAEKNYYN
jgi:hypothetical protein